MPRRTRTTLISQRKVRGTGGGNVADVWGRGVAA